MVHSITPRIPSGGTIPMSPLPKQAAFRQLDRYLYTSRTSRFQIGGFVDLKAVPEEIPIVYVGDLHARVDNLNRFLNFARNYELLKDGKLVVNILGDAVHPENGHTDMDSSVVMMQQIMDLKITNPDNFYYYAGNHDSFSTKAMRIVNGYPVFPGVLMQLRLEELYGGDYIERFGRLISTLPVVSVANGVITTHGGPIRPPFNMQQLINLNPANEDAPMIKQAIWGRFECVEDPKLSYDMNDVGGFLTAMDQENATLLVAHTKPGHGNWHREIAPNHHVIFGALDKFGYAFLQHGRLNFADASGAAPFTVGRLPVEFFSDTSLPKDPKKTVEETIEANAGLFEKGGLYDRSTSGETIMAIGSSDIETCAFAAQDGTLVAFGNERDLSYGLAEMLMQGLLYKIEISETSVSRKPGLPRFFCTLPFNMPENIRDIILKTVERANRAYIVEHNSAIILDHVRKQPKSGKDMDIPILMENNGRILSITDIDGFDDTILEGIERGRYCFTRISLSKKHFLSKPAYQLPMRLRSLLDGDVLAVTLLTLDDLNKA